MTSASRIRLTTFVPNPLWRRLFCLGAFSLLTNHAALAGASGPTQRETQQPKRHDTTITGQAFAITIRGEVIFAARIRVWLFPITPTTTAWYEQTSKHGRSLPLRDPQMARLSRSTSTDENGRFEFAGLPPGDYYVISHLSAGVHTGWGMLPGGVVLHNRAQVGAGESQKVVLTAQVQPGVGFH